jgi:hypothetical protein
MGKRLQIADFPPHVQEQIRSQLDAPRAPPRASVQTPEAPVGRRGPPTLVRQRTREPNKTELRFASWARSQGYKPEFEALTFGLANGARFTPDYISPLPEGGDWPLVCFDVKGTWSNNKGRIEDDAAVKVKVAARQWPGFHFFLAWENKHTGLWNLQRILP